MDERPVETTASRIGSELLERILALDTLRFVRPAESAMMDRG
jgi:hypothetical protein